MANQIKSDPMTGFVNFALASGCLKFGNFTLKSGRKSTYFFDSGACCQSDSLFRLGEFYAETILAHRLEFDVLFGPAYKGIPLVCATAMALSAKTGKSIPFCFNRKEPKQYGVAEQTELIGAPIAGLRVLVIDDVVTSGTTLNQSIALIEKEKATLAGVVVALDRQESSPCIAISKPRDFGL